MTHPADNGGVLKQVDEIRAYEHQQGAAESGQKIAELQAELAEANLTIRNLDVAYKDLLEEFEEYVLNHPDEDGEPPDPDPEPKEFGKRLHLCQQVGSTSEMNNFEDEFVDCLKTVPATNALSGRWPWKSYEASPTLGKATLDLSYKLGLKYTAFRSMAGKHTPSTKMGATLTEGGVTYPSPFSSDGKGGPNQVFIDHLEAHNMILAKLLAESGETDPILQWTWFAKEWAEIYHGPGVRAAAGYSVDNFIAAHKAIIDAAARVQKAYPSVLMGLQLSGHGPIGTVRSESQKKNVVLVEELVKHACTKFAPGRAVIHANGWSYRGQWGQQDMAVDATMDAAFTAAEDGGLLVGMQAIQPWGGVAAYPQYTAPQTAQAYQQATDVHTDTIEVYTPSFQARNGGSVWAPESQKWATEV